MSFMQQLESHVGGLIRLRAELFWYGGRGWDRSPGRVCLLLDAVDRGARRGCAASSRHSPRAIALLLIDGCPQYVWVAPEDVEIL